ncbi:MAG: MBL fold metallo-hydrolase, partial [Actinomycetota bacterium]|nr:MBL fold metallo-hydrolase [Actinomycetota bacterium]
TGMDGYSRGLGPGATVRASALLSHYHFDHVQGLPFFAPMDVEGASLRIFAPEGGGPLERLFAPPFFPVSPLRYRGEISAFRIRESRFELPESGVEVLALEVPHTDTAFGYRIEAGGISICYIPDHQAPSTLDTFDERALRLAEGADLLIHDAQYSEAEFAVKGDWGHSTQGYAAALAQRAGAKHVVLFHHDPARSDSELVLVERDTAARYARNGLRVTAARQGEVILLSDQHAAAAGAL